MALSETVLLERAKEFELKRSQKIRFSPSFISDVDELLHDVCIARNPRPNDYQHRRDLIRVFNLMVKDIYGNCDGFPVVEVFGSFPMDIFFAKSDLDLSINFSSGAVNFPHEKKISSLRKFANFLYTLQSEGHVFGIQPIMGAKVPIVKFVDRGTGIECDVSVENKDGIAKSQIIHIITAIDERFQKLSFLMKAWANANDINSSKARTLSSLSIILLTAFHLQTREPPILPPFSVLFKEGTDPENVGKAVHKFLYCAPKNNESVAELFITLLSKLASVEKLWPEGLCASTYKGSWISKKWGSRIGNISVEDFTYRSQNVARAVGVEQVKKIYKCIQSSLDHLAAFKEGQITASKLRTVLFGHECKEVNDVVNVNQKRKFPFEDSPTPPCTVPIRKMRSIEHSDPRIRKYQTYHEFSNNRPPVTPFPPLPPQWPQIGPPEFVYGSSHSSFVQPQHFGGLQQNPLGFLGSHNLNPMIPMPPYGGLGNVHPSYNEDQFFNPYGHW